MSINDEPPNDADRRMEVTDRSGKEAAGHSQTERSRDGRHAGRHSSLSSSSSWVCVPFGMPRGLPVVYVAAAAVEQMLQFSGDHDNREVGGILVGSMETDGPQPTTRVVETVAATKAAGDRTRVEFSHDTWADILTQVEAQDTGVIVGWYHSHPGIGVFLSTQDRFVHESFFGHPGHIAIVIDPIAKTFGAYTWQDRRGDKSLQKTFGIWVAAPAGDVQAAKKTIANTSYHAAPIQSSPPGRIPPSAAAKGPADAR